MTSTDAILAGKYPAKAHARRVAEYLRQHGGLSEGSDGVIYLEAQKTRLHEDTDTELPFRFVYTGARELGRSMLTGGQTASPILLPLRMPPPRHGADIPFQCRRVDAVHPAAGPGLGDLVGTAAVAGRGAEAVRR